MTRPTVAMLDPMSPASQEVIAQEFGDEFEVIFVDEDTAEARRQAAARAQVILTLWGRVDEATVRAATDCRLIQKLGVGIDNVDVPQARAQGIRVLIAAGINAQAVAELAVLHMLGVGRNLDAALTAARTGRVEKEVLRSQSFQLYGKTIGIIGLGHIGQAVARRLGGFGVTLIYHDVRTFDAQLERELQVRRVGFDELLRTADVITVHVPLNAETKHLIDADALAKVKPSAVVINTARGPIVDEVALSAAIADGRLLGAGLDVTETEPLPADSALHQLDRVILTPHIGGAVANNFPRVVRRALVNARAVLAGEPVAAEDIIA